MHGCVFLEEISRSFLRALKEGKDCFRFRISHEEIENSRELHNLHCFNTKSFKSKHFDLVLWIMFMWKQKGERLYVGRAYVSGLESVSFDEFTDNRLTYLLLYIYPEFERINVWSYNAINSITTS